jgi:hypothetical protein
MGLRAILVVTYAVITWAGLRHDWVEIALLVATEEGRAEVKRISTQ